MARIAWCTCADLFRFLQSLLGSTLNSALGSKPHGGGSHGSSPFGGLAGQVVGGLLNSGHSSGGGHSSSGGIGGKLASQLASNLFSSGNKPTSPQNYHGGQQSGHVPSGGLVGGLVGGVAGMFTGKPHSSVG